MNDWAVYRKDFNGNEFLVDKGLSEAQAIKLAAHYESLKHHQHYWVDKQPTPSRDFTAIALEILNNGSPLKLVQAILETHGANQAEIAKAIEAANKRINQK